MQKLCHVMTIVIDGNKVICDKTVLEDNCDYFKALTRFEENLVDSLSRHSFNPHISRFSVATKA